MVPDVVVAGAGAFGAWTAWHLHRAGLKVTLCDPHGPANSRASSGGESRIIRMGYGPREIYTRWSQRSMQIWREFIDATDPTLFHPCGALWIASVKDGFAIETAEVLQKCGVAFDRLDVRALRGLYPQFHFDDEEWGVFEPGAGALMARRSIQTLVRQLIADGVHYEQRPLHPEHLKGGVTVFACGPWLPELFPELLGRRIIPSRQEVLFFATPAAGDVYGPRGTPCWMDVSNGFYGLPDLENRGFKLANDKRGRVIDPNIEERLVELPVVHDARRYLAKRVPELAGAALVEARVCQYENTANGDYLIDRHPEKSNVWLAGGGSGHGFKHGPAAGEYLRDLILGRREPEDRFSLQSKIEFGGPESQSTFYR